MNLDTTQGMNDAINWTNNTLQMLNIGGSWIIPRSGVIVTRTGEKSCKLAKGFSEDEAILRVLKAGKWDVTV